ncbi:licD [Acanthosepion pharaonis]|uniref:LicD n=1 Tax=Acanthosepion pharaonis TaxID=158019 RepID=A0A812ALL9_ACAPH|nr:licD [Sepia pharaonis]
MSSASKTTHRREIFCVVIFLTLVSILYQCYANISFRRVEKTPTKSSNIYVPGCPAPDVERVHNALIFPALQNFSIRDNIGPHFGQFPLQAKELLKTNNFTDRQLFAFMPAMTQPEKLVSLFVFQKFINICSQDNITFFIQGGTLLGSYRHHGFVPWDDDIDVYVDSKDRKKLFCSLKKAAPMFDVRQYPRFQWKFYYTKTPTLKAYRYRWPFVDIFFFSVEGDNIFDVTSGRKNYVFKYNNVFPLGTSLILFFVFFIGLLSFAFFFIGILSFAFFFFFWYPFFRFFFFLVVSFLSLFVGFSTFILSFVCLL